MSASARHRVRRSGKSGSGKSSLFRILYRLYEPGQGRILLDGVSIDTMEVEALRRLIAVVPQDTILFNDTLENNLRWAARRRHGERLWLLRRLHD